MAFMTSDELPIEEQAAADAICGAEDVKSWEKLTPQGSTGTPDFRFVLADDRVADVEVTMHTDGAARSFKHQLSEERDGKGRAGNGRYARVWKFSELSYLWTAKAADPSPFTNQGQPVRLFVDGIKDVLAEAERSEETPAGMRQRANREFEFRRLQAEDSIEARFRRHARVLKDPEHRGPGEGAIKTHAAIEGSFSGEIGALRQAVRDCARHKAGKAQFDAAPGERWLAVMLDSSVAWWQFDDHFGPEAPKPYPDLTDLMDDYFDEIWVVAKASPPPSYVAVRLIKLDSRQERHVVARPDGEPDPASSPS